MQATLIGNKIGRQDLQRYESIEARVLSQIDFAHATAAKAFDDFKRTNLLSGFGWLNTEQHVSVPRDGRFLDKVSCRIVRVNQRVRLSLQLSIATTHSFEEGSTLGRCAIKCRLQDLLDLLPTFRGHSVLLRSLHKDVASL